MIKTKLIKTFTEHIKGYGFTHDLINDTRWGMSRSELDQYIYVWEEFEEDPYLPKHIVNIPTVPYKEIPCGTLRIYGVMR